MDDLRREAEALADEMLPKGADPYNYIAFDDRNQVSVDIDVYISWAQRLRSIAERLQRGALETEL